MLLSHSTSSPDVYSILLAKPCLQTCMCFRARFRDVLANWDPILKPDPYLDMLGRAFVQRLAKDSRILKLLPEDMGVPGQKKSKCPGCAKCNGNTWMFKTETVAHLYAMLCE